MSNGMLPTSGHSGKVRGCCQPPQSQLTSFSCALSIFTCSPPCWHMSDIFVLLWFCHLDGALGAQQKTNTLKTINQPTNQQISNHQIRVAKKNHVTSDHLLANLFRFSPFFPKCKFHSGAQGHKRGPRVRCWFKVLAEQSLAGAELRAKSWPFCSLLAYANFFLGLSESIKELPECSHQSFNYSW